MYPEATPAIVGMMKLRRALQPFLHDLLWRHHAEYQPVSRPLWLDFPGDPAAEDGDAHLLGPDVLVAPAMDPGWQPSPLIFLLARYGAICAMTEAYAGGQCHGHAGGAAGGPAANAGARRVWRVSGSRARRVQTGQAPARRAALCAAGRWRARLVRL
jgi:alpha-glucosidase